VLAALANDKNADVRMAVAGNPNTPVQVLELFIQSVVAELALATGSPRLTSKLAKLPEDARRAYAQGDFLYYHGKDPGKSVLARRSMACIMALCAGPFVEPARIARVAGSSDWLVRAALARNRGTPPNLLKKLDNDAHPLVRALALSQTAPAPKSGSHSFEQSHSGEASPDPQAGAALHSDLNLTRVWDALAHAVKTAPGRFSIRVQLAQSKAAPSERRWRPLRGTRSRTFAAQ
jgi:hypothetical protein